MGVAPNVLWRRGFTGEGLAPKKVPSDAHMPKKPLRSLGALSAGDAVDMARTYHVPRTT
jgi:hypothetical protein